VTINAMTTTSGTPSNHRIIGMTVSIVVDHGIDQLNNTPSWVWFQTHSDGTNFVANVF